METYNIASKPIKYDKYIVLKKTSEGLKKGHWTYIAMIDRSKSKAHWWTVDKDMTMQFDLASAAKAKAESLKYGPCIAVSMNEFDKYVGMEFWKKEKKERDWITKAIQSKEGEYDCESNQDF